MRSKGSLRRHFYRPRAGARRANHHPCLALVAPMSHCFACSLALLLSLPKELSLLPPPAALQFLAPQRRGTKPIAGLILSSYLSPYAHSTQHLPSARIRQAVIGSGTPSPEAGEGRGRGQMHLRYPKAPFSPRFGKPSFGFPSGRSGAWGLGVPPSVFCIWGPRRVARPVGERRSGGALEGCLFRRNSDPTWSAARDDAHEQKEVPAG